jgi:hypothetical protein
MAGQLSLDSPFFRSVIRIRCIQGCGLCVAKAADAVIGSLRLIYLTRITTPAVGFDALMPSNATVPLGVNCKPIWFGAV